MRSLVTGHRRAAGRRHPAAEAGHADAAGGQGRAAVCAVRVRRHSAAAGPGLSGAQLAPARDNVAGGNGALQPGREEEAEKDDPGRACDQRQRGQGQRGIRGRRRIAGPGRGGGSAAARRERRATAGGRESRRTAAGRKNFSACRVGAAHVVVTAATFPSALTARGGCDYNDNDIVVRRRR